MKKLTKYAEILVLWSISCCLMVACGKQESEPSLITLQTKIAEAPLVSSLRQQGIAAKVNGDLIYESEVRQVMLPVIMNYNKRYGEYKMPRPQYEKYRIDAIQKLIYQQLWIQRAKDMNISISDQQVERAYMNLKKQSSLQMDFDKFLADSNLTTQDLKTRIRKELLAKKAQAAIAKKILPLDSPVLELYYKDNMDRFDYPVRYELREIMIEIPYYMSPDEVENARSKIFEAYNKLKEQGGSNFIEMVEEYSTAPSKAKDGYLGYVLLGEDDEKFKAALADMHIGDFSPPFQTPAGYHIIKLEGIREAGIAPFEEVKEKIWGQLLPEFLEREIKRYYLNSEIQIHE